MCEIEGKTLKRVLDIVSAVSDAAALEPFGDQEGYTARLTVLSGNRAQAVSVFFKDIEAKEVVGIPVLGIKTAIGYLLDEDEVSMGIGEHWLGIRGTNWEYSTYLIDPTYIMRLKTPIPPKGAAEVVTAGKTILRSIEAARAIDADAVKFRVTKDVLIVQAKGHGRKASSEEFFETHISKDELAGLSLDGEPFEVSFNPLLIEPLFKLHKKDAVTVWLDKEKPMSIHFELSDSIKGWYMIASLAGD